MRPMAQCPTTARALGTGPPGASDSRWSIGVRKPRVTVVPDGQTGLVLDDDACYRAVLARDARFDGWFFSGVRTTGIFCRPSCPARTPHRRNIEFHPTSAAAVRAGFRACLRCRPDTTPGSPEWNLAGDVAARAVRAINDGIVDREGIPGLADRLGYSVRQLHRLLTSSLGAGPIELARAHRAATARTLLETTELPITQVAFASGFRSTRQFNDTIRDVFACTPTALRHHRRATTPRATGSEISLRLALRPPYAAAPIFQFLATRAVEGVEVGSATSYARTMALPHASGTLAVDAPAPDARWVTCRLRLDDFRDLPAAVERTRRLLDLDADPVAVDAALRRDTVLRHGVARHPGIRVPGHVDGDEVAIRAVLGQQVSVAAATRLANVLTDRYGETVSSDGPLCRMFPDAATLAKLDPADLPMPRARGRTLIELCRALADGTVRLDAAADRDDVGTTLGAIKGIGPWTVSYVRMRALGDPDAFLPGDLALRRALEGVGRPSSERRATEAAQAWRPYRSYAMVHLWSYDTGAPRRAAAASAAPLRTPRSRAPRSRTPSKGD
jgi:AraC family transcriptional regulator, regulatory protein of adaptative response / DNA-3-methyladenine glycosylase II